MSVPRVILILLATNSIALIGSRTAQAQRNIFRDVIREGANQILNNGQGNAQNQPPGGEPPKAMRSAIPGESGRDSGGNGFDRTEGWIPIQPTPQPQPYQPQPQPYQPQPQPYQPQPYQPDSYRSQRYSEPPTLVDPANGLPLKITVPKAENGSISYTLITPSREIPLSLNSGYSQNLKATSVLMVRYNGSRGTTTYRLRGGKKYVFKKKSGSFWDLYTVADVVPEPPVLSEL